MHRNRPDSRIQTPEGMQCVHWDTSGRPNTATTEAVIQG